MHGTSKRDEDEESESLPPPDGGWGWFVVFGSFMIHVITDGVTYSFGIFYDEFLEYFNEGGSVTSWILSLLVGVTLCSGPISSSLVNRWGCRIVTIAGAILAGVCLIASFWAQNVLTLCLTIGIGTGLGFGLIYLPAIVSVTTYFEKKRSLATGIAVCGSGFGTFIFAPIISRLLPEYGWRGSILIIAGIVFECIIFGSLFRPLEPEKDVVKQLKTTEGTMALHDSHHELPPYTAIQSNGNGMHRPHSVAHFSIPTKGHKFDSRLNAQMRSHNGDIARLALSQPMLTQNEIHKHRQFYASLKRHHGPLDRIDVFYQGSLMNIPSYKSKLDLKHNEESNFIKRKHSAMNKKEEVDIVEETRMCGLISCSPETKDTLKTMFDFSLLKDPVFLLFSLSNLFTSIGFNIPYVYLVPKAKALGMSGEEAGILLSVIGGANTVGRIVLGYISDKPWVNRLQIYNWSLTLCGLATLISAFCGSFNTLAVYGSVFGFTIGAYVGLTSVILVDLLGLEKLTNAFGLLLLFQGIASLVGPPIAGWICDLTLSYDPAFLLAGVAVALSGVMLFAIPPLQKWQSEKLHKKGVLDVPDEV